MIIKDEILKQVTDFKTLCQKHNVKSLYAFGSSTTDNFDFNNSDIDLLVEIEDIDPIERDEKLISLWDTFELFFNRKVDLLADSSIRNPYLRKVLIPLKFIFMTEKGQKYLSDIIHPYDTVDSSMIWAILKRHLGPLKEEVKQKIQ